MGRHGTKYLLKTPRPRCCKLTKANFVPSKPVYSGVDRFIPHRHIELSEFLLNSKANQSRSAHKRWHTSSSSSSSRSQADDSMEESLTSSISDESLMSASTSSSFPMSMSENSFTETDCHDDALSGQVAAILFEGYENKREKILNFRQRKNKTDYSTFPRPLQHVESNDDRMGNGRLQADQRSRFLNNLEPESVFSTAERTTEVFIPRAAYILDVNSEGDILLVNDNAVYTWNPISPQFCKLYEPHLDNFKNDYAEISCMGWHDSAKMFATGTVLMGQTRASVTLTNPDSSLGRRYYDEFKLGSSPLCIQWNRTGVTCGCEDGGVYHYDDRCRSNRPELAFDGHGFPVTSCRYNKAGDLLATGDALGDLLIWDTRQPKQPVNTFREAHAGRIVAMTWCPWQPDLLATGNARKDPTLKFWNLNTGLKSRERRVLHEITSIQWHEAERELISSHVGTSEDIVVWSYPSLERRGIIQRRREHKGTLNIGLIKKSSTLVSLSADYCMYVWNLDQSKGSYAVTSQSRRTSSMRRSPFQLGLIR